MDLNEALNEIINGPINQLNWAMDYALHAQRMIAAGETEYELWIQLNYVISNTQSWRGPIAREAKAVIRKAIKELKGKI